MLVSGVVIHPPPAPADSFRHQLQAAFQSSNDHVLASALNQKNWPIGSMNGISIPTWMVDFHGKCRQIYHSWILWVYSCQNKKHGLRLTADFSKSLPFPWPNRLVIDCSCFSFQDFLILLQCWDVRMANEKELESPILMTTWNHVWSAERFWRNSVHLWSNHMQHIHVWRNLYANYIHLYAY